jgi:hypothetical protein
MTVNDLASSCSVDPDALDRVLRLLAAHGIFERQADAYLHTPSSRLLCSDHPMSMLAGDPLKASLHAGHNAGIGRNSLSGTLAVRQVHKELSGAGSPSGGRRPRLFRRDCPLGGRHPIVEVDLRESRPRRNIRKLAEEVVRLRDPRPA